MNKLDRALSRVEAFVISGALGALLLSFALWVSLKGLSSRTTSEFFAGLVFRALFGACVLGAITWRFSKRTSFTVFATVFGAGIAWLWKDTGVEWASNVLGWLQDGSLLTWMGGLRGLGTRLTLILAMTGAAVATSQGKHVSIDFLTRLFSEKARRWLGITGGLIAVLVCTFAAYGFWDFLSVDSLGGTPGATLSRHTGYAFKQLLLDLKMTPRVLGGAKWDQSLTGVEWNDWLGDAPEFVPLKETDAAAFRTPLLAVPGELPRGLLAKDLGIIVPIGLLWLALRFVLWVLLGGKKAEDHAAPPVEASRWQWLFPIAALIGAPLFALMAGGAELAWWLHGAPLSRLAPRVMDEQFAGSPVLVTIPLFTALGYVLAESQAPQRIVSASRALFGWLPGGLALVCLVASAFFTSLTGGSGVTIVAIGGLLYPALRNEGYPEKFSLGLVTTGGSLGLLLPPSLAILVYALVAGLDMTAAFKAGLIPAALVMVVLGLWSARVGIKEKIPRSKFEPKAALAALGTLKWELAIPVLILGGLATSLTTLEESAAIALVWCLVTSLFVHRDVQAKSLPKLFAEALSLSGAVILILMMANALMNFVVDAQVPEGVLNRLLALGLTERWQFLIVLNVFLLVVGMLMDGFSALLVAVPLVLPFAAHFGLHPFQLAMMVLLNLELAFCMPPLGLNLFIASFRFQRPVASLYRSVVPFVLLLTVCLVAVMAFPKLSTVLVQSDIDDARAKAIARGDAPREAWILECVQQDTLNPQPCSEEERVKYAPPDAGTEESEDDALMREMMGQ